MAASPEKRGKKASSAKQDYRLRIHPSLIIKTVTEARASARIARHLR